MYKKVAVVEDFFDIIYREHVEFMNNSGGRPATGKHAGQKRTYRAVSVDWASRYIVPPSRLTHITDNLEIDHGNLRVPPARGCDAVPDAVRRLPEARQRRRGSRRRCRQSAVFDDPSQPSPSPKRSLSRISHPASFSADPSDSSSQYKAAEPPPPTTPPADAAAVPAHVGSHDQQHRPESAVDQHAPQTRYAGWSVTPTTSRTRSRRKFLFST